MNSDDLKQFVDTELKIINRIFDIQKKIVPMVILVKDDSRYQIPATYSSSAHKDIVSQGIKDLVKTSEPDVVVFVAEAWTKIVQNLADRLPIPSQDLDRVEKVIVQIEFKTGEKYGCAANILRDDGAPRLGKFEINPLDLSMGRFCDFFPITKKH